MIEDTRIPIRPVFVTHCLGCKKRIHSWSPQALLKRIDGHTRNCNALKKKPKETPA